jgi:hypothetical protein
MECSAYHFIIKLDMEEEEDLDNDYLLSTADHNLKTRNIETNIIKYCVFNGHLLVKYHLKTKQVGNIFRMGVFTLQ